jgi:hypothetical protein
MYYKNSMHTIISYILSILTKIHNDEDKKKEEVK